MSGGHQPLPHPDRLVKSIRPLSGLLGWDQGSKSSAFPDIGCGGCS
uniref:Uncharacterized protein n=1 Tax=Fagus sylvatica TaxID=28930 RepID=A0A2N9G742_FAGSY